MSATNKKFKFALPWILAPLVSGTAWFKDWQKLIGAKTPSEALLGINPWMLLGTAGCFLMVGFVTKVWKEVEDDAVKGSAAVLRALPGKAGEILGRLKDVLSAFVEQWSPGFERKYRRRAFERFGLFNDRGLGLVNANRLDLEKVYVELRVRADVNLVRPQLDPLSRIIEGREPIWTFLRALRDGFAIVLLGAPGSGKTTLLQHLLIVFVRGHQGTFRARRRLPILLELRTLRRLFERDKIPSFSEVVREQWRKDFVDLKAPKNWLEHRMRRGRLIVLIDGLDELPTADLRRRAADWLEKQMSSEASRHCQFILTSRPGGYNDARLQRAEVLEVQPFSPKQARQFIHCWYLANEIVASGQREDGAVRRLASEEATALLQRLDVNPDIYALAVNPLLLTMVCMVHRYHGALPGSRSQLYAEICQVLLERWRQSREIQEDLRGDQKLSVLRPLAEQYMIRGIRELAEDEVMQIINPHLEAVGYLGENAGTRFLSSIQAGSGLLLEREAGNWAWAHKTFQEYLTAEHWLQNPQESRVWEGLVASEWWRETVLLFAAKADASGIVEAALLDESPNALGLAFELLTGAQRLRPEVRRSANEKLRSALTSEDAQQFKLAAIALHNIRDREVVTIGDGVTLRRSAVTQAEYQLFLDSLREKDRLQCLPPHWNSLRFSGDPEAPVLGVFGFQAERFRRWTRSARRRLPSVDEVPDELAGEMTYCSRNGTIGGHLARCSGALGYGFYYQRQGEVFASLRSFAEEQKLKALPLSDRKQLLSPVPKEAALAFAIALGCPRDLWFVLRYVTKRGLAAMLRKKQPKSQPEPSLPDGRISKDGIALLTVLLARAYVVAATLHPLSSGTNETDREFCARLHELMKSEEWIRQGVELQNSVGKYRWCKPLIEIKLVKDWWELRSHLQQFVRELLPSLPKTPAAIEMARVVKILAARERGEQAPCEAIFLVRDRRTHRTPIVK